MVILARSIDEQKGEAPEAMLRIRIRCSSCCPTDQALSCVAMAADGRRGPKVDARRLPDFDWNALRHVSCSALLGGEPSIGPLAAFFGSRVFPRIPAELGPHFRKGDRGIF